MFKLKRLVAAALLIAMHAFVGSAAFAESAVLAPVPRADSVKASGPLQTAVLAGGCFWGVEGVFEHVRGVREVLSGYAGGETSTAQYDAVSSGRTGHAESVEITFDPQEISYGELLRIFFSVAHDPTQLNRQGPDTGTQYRSAMFYAYDTLEGHCEGYIAQLNESGLFRHAIVTRVDPLEPFYPAERHDQDFIAKNPRYPYVVFNDLPKIRNLKQVFPALYQEGS